MKKKNVKQLLSALLVIAMMATLLVVPAAAADKTEVDVWDFGAQQLADTDQYHFVNHLNADVINSWYPADIEKGTTGHDFPSTGMPDVAGLSYTTNGASNHRLRTTNTALTRKDEKDMTGDGKDPYFPGDPVTYNGYIYSNSAKNTNVYFQIALQSGDIVTAIVSSNGTDSLVEFAKVDGEVEGSYLQDLGSSAKGMTMTFYAKETGNYKIYSVTEKLTLARLYRQHATEVTVSGAVTEPAGTLAEYSLVFTNTKTGAEIKIPVSGGKYSGTLLAPYSYDVSLEGANGIAVETGRTVEVKADETAKIHNVGLKAIDRVKVSGSISGLPADQLAKMELVFAPVGDDVVYQPEITVDKEAGTYEALVEKGRETNLSAKFVNDYAITEDTDGLTFTADTPRNIVFEAKPTYPITIDPQGLTLADLANATFVFTKLDEADVTEDQYVVPFNPKSDDNLSGTEYHYVYTFPGTDGIALRDGIYDVAVTTTAGKQNVTSNLKVEGKATTKTIKFTPAASYVAPGTYNFEPKAASLNDVDGMSGNFTPHGSGHGLVHNGAGGQITLSLAEAAKITVTTCCFGNAVGNLTVDGGTLSDTVTDTSEEDKGVKGKVFTITAEAGEVTLNFGSTTYVHSIAVEAATKVYPTEWDFGTWADGTKTEGAKQGDPVPATVLNGITVTGQVKNHVSEYGIYIKNGKLDIPVSGPCTVTVSVGNSYDIKFPGDTEAKVATGSVPKKTTFSYDYEGEEGTVTVEFGNGATTYIDKITVEYPEVVYYGTYWDFKNDDLGKQGTPYYDENSAEGITLPDEDGVGAMHVYGGKFQYHGSSYGTTGNGYTMVVPVMTACTVKVDVGYSWTIWSPNYPDHTTAETADKQVADAGHKTLELKYEQEEPGEVTIYAVKGDTTYVKAVTVEYGSDVELPKPPVVEDIVYTVGTGKRFQTITAALDAAAAAKRDATQRITIEIDPGNYEEQLYVKTKDITLKNAAADKAELKLTDKGVNIGANEVRITHYYGHGYTYYSMTKGHRYDEDVLKVNNENGYASYTNEGSGTTDDSYWNASVIIAADGFQAEGIIFENSFNQYISKKAAEDTLEAQSSAKEAKGNPRAKMKDVGDTTVQDKAYVERAAALSIKSGTKIFFDNCAFVGRQDTLYGQEGSTVAFYNCDVYGGTDYIFGGMTAVFAKCDLVFNTSEDNNDVGYITAPQQKSDKERGYLMYNCHVTSTVPGENTASTKVSKPGAFGRPWEAATSEAVFYATDVDATDPSYYTGDTAKGTSMIQGAGWLDSLSGKSARCGDYGTVEYYEGADTSADRVTWSAKFTEAKTADGQSMEDYEGWLGGWDPFVGKDMTVKNQTPQPFGKETAAVESVKVTPETLTLKVNDTYEVTADVTPVDANATVYWTTEDTTVISLSATEGDKVTVKALAAGKATITATAGDKTATVAVTVEDEDQPGPDVPPETDEITISIDTSRITVRKTEALRYTLTPADAEYGTIYWVSDDTSVLSVTTSGTATGVKTGKANVTAYVLKSAADGLAESNILAQATREIQVVSAGSVGGGGSSGRGTTSTTTTTKTNANGDTVKTETKSNGDKTITVTDKDGNVLVKLEIPAQTPDLGYKFTDVPDDHWAEPSIQAMAALKVFQGVSATGHIFDMNSAVTRGTMAQILFNLSQGKAGMTNAFADVAAGAWYTDAIAWAAAAGVVNGVSDTNFAPNDSITREQLITMLYRYAQLLALDTNVTADMGKFVDADEIDSWASEAMTWAVGKGLIIGKGAGTLDPKAAASRAEAAVIIDRFLMMVK